MSTEQTAIRTSLFSIFGNTLLALIKGISGILGNSFALVADAIESTTDIFSSLVVFLGFKYANKPPDENHPYGHGKIEPLVTFVVVGFLIFSAVVIAYESINNINTPHNLPESWTLLVLGAIIIWKELSYQFVLRKSKQINSSSLKADAWHHRSDAITSISAFIGITVALILGKGYETADDWAALLASAFILYNSYLIFRPAFGEVMDEHTHDEVIKEIRAIAKTVDGIDNTEKCMVRKSGLTYHIELHAIVNEDLTVKQGHDLSHILKDKLKEKMSQLGNVVIHIEPTK